MEMEGCPEDLEGLYPLLASFSFFLPLEFLCPHAACWYHLLGEGRGGAAYSPQTVVPAREGGPAHRSPSELGAGRSWRPAGGACLERATPAEGRLGGGRTCLTTGRQGPASSGLSANGHGVECDLSDGPSGWKLSVCLDCGGHLAISEAAWVQCCLSPSGQ